MRKQEAGVTLIELLTVMVVLAILASIAVPSYRSYLLRANRSDAKSALLDVQAAQEKYYLQHNAYTTNVTSKPPDGLGLSGTTTHGYYQIKVALGESDQTYTATAEPVAGAGQQDDKKCGTFTLTDTGRRDASSGNVDLCWK